MFFKKKTVKKTYDRENQKPVLKCSICNGEQVAGFLDIHTNVFIVHEIVTVEQRSYRKLYGLEFDTIPAYNALKPFHREVQAG